jgi:23S rRNA-/tRNA-specific pseudouridylate synthase
MWNLDFRAPGHELDVQELVARAWPQASPKQRNAAISAGEVRIAGEVTREAKTRVAPGSRVQVVAREGQLVSSPPAIEILQRGQDFCVVDKPTGWPSHAATAGGPDARALVAASLDSSIDDIWPVHRLDADVSGAWLIALTQEAASRLSTSFAQDVVTKEYRALAPRLPWCEGRFRAGVDGKAAETIFRVLSEESEAPPARDPHPEICEVSLTLVTGRTHQLRRHLAGARCPILGDNLYGGAMVAGGLRLYSRRIEIQDEDVNATAPEPAGYAVEEPIYSTSDKPVEITVSHATAVALERGHPWILTDTERFDVRFFTGQSRTGTSPRFNGWFCEGSTHHVLPVDTRGSRRPPRPDDRPRRKRTSRSFNVAGKPSV